MKKVQRFTCKQVISPERNDANEKISMKTDQLGVFFFQLDIYLGIRTSLLVKLAEQADVGSFIAIVTEIPH